MCVCCTVTSLFALASVQLPNLSWPLCCRCVRYFFSAVLFFSFHYILVTVLLLFFLACLPLLPFLSSPGCCTSSSILTLWIGCLTACLGLCVPFVLANFVQQLLFGPSPNLCFICSATAAEPEQQRVRRPKQGESKQTNNGQCSLFLYFILCFCHFAAASLPWPRFASKVLIN